MWTCSEWVCENYPFLALRQDESVAFVSISCNTRWPVYFRSSIRIGMNSLKTWVFCNNFRKSDTITWVSHHPQYLNMVSHPITQRFTSICPLINMCSWLLTLKSWERRCTFSCVDCVKYMIQNNRFKMSNTLVAWRSQFFRLFKFSIWWFCSKVWQSPSHFYNFVMHKMAPTVP